MTMPKATIHENSYFASKENKIGMTFDRIFAPPATDIHLSKHTY